MVNNAGSGDGERLGGFMIEDFELPDSVEQQSGKVKSLLEEDDAAMTRRLELDPVQPAAEAPINPFQAIIDSYRRAGMSIAEVDKVFEQGRKGGIAPPPPTPTPTQTLHWRRRCIPKGSRRIDHTVLSIKEEVARAQRGGPGMSFHSVYDPRRCCVSFFVFFSHRIT